MIGVMSGGGGDGGGVVAIAAPATGRSPGDGSERRKPSDMNCVCRLFVCGDELIHKNREYGAGFR